MPPDVPSPRNGGVGVVEVTSATDSLPLSLPLSRSAAIVASGDLATMDDFTIDHGKMQPKPSLGLAKTSIPALRTTRPPPGSRVRHWVPSLSAPTSSLLLAAISALGSIGVSLLSTIASVTTLPGWGMPSRFERYGEHTYDTSTFVITPRLQPLWSSRSAEWYACASASASCFDSCASIVGEMPDTEPSA